MSYDETTCSSASVLSCKKKQNNETMKYLFLQPFPVFLFSLSPMIPCSADQVRSWAWWRTCSPAWAPRASLPGRGVESVLTLCSTLWSSSAWNPTASISKSRPLAKPLRAGCLFPHHMHKHAVQIVFLFRKASCVKTPRLPHSPAEAGNVLIVHRSRYA